MNNSACPLALRDGVTAHILEPTMGSSCGSSSPFNGMLSDTVLDPAAA